MPGDCRFVAAHGGLLTADNFNKFGAPDGSSRHGKWFISNDCDVVVIRLWAGASKRVSVDGLQAVVLTAPVEHVLVM